MSSQRFQAATDAVWKVAIVTNRKDAAVPVGINEDRRPVGSLLQQTRELSLQNPDSTYAFCDVRVSSKRARGTCSLDRQASGGLAVGELQVSSRDRFLHELQELQATPLDVLVFVHGFNVKLDHAIARAAQLAEDLPFHGTIIAFSWQSQGGTEAYRSDERTAERYFWNLAKLLYDLKTELPDSRLHVLAHSMGNRVTLRAINALCGTIDPMGNRDLYALRSLSDLSGGGSDRQTDPPVFQSVVRSTVGEIKQRYPEWGAWRASSTPQPAIDNLIMAAPDVGVSQYQAWIAGLKHTCGNMVLYASDTDFALEGSRLINGQGFRAGDSRASMKIPGLTTIRVTGVTATDRLGHSFYGSRPVILDQLAFLMNGPQNRSLQLP
ncbi:MAG: alpha/beta fold hydrolase [Fuerstiella sp.]